MKSRFLVEYSTASCYGSLKTVTTIKIIVKICEKCFVQTKNYSKEVNFLLWEKLHIVFNQFEIYFGFSFKKTLMVGGLQKRARKNT